MARNHHAAEVDSKTCMEQQFIATPRSVNQDEVIMVPFPPCLLRPLGILMVRMTNVHTVEL